MIIAPYPHNEQARLATLKQYDILDTESDPALNAMVQLASYICQTPIAAISLIDERRQWFKASAGLDVTETPRDIAFCSHAIIQEDPLVVQNALLDDRFFDNPLVTSDPEFRFYAGVPLTTAKGHHLGTLCVIDRIPRTLTPEQLNAIKVLAQNVMAHLDLQIAYKNAGKYIDDLQMSEMIFNTASEAILVTDGNNTIVLINPAFTLITGYSPNEVIGRHYSILYSKSQSTKFYQKVLQTLNDTGHWDGELWATRKNAEEYVQSLSVNSILNSDGTKRLHVGIFSDVTERKRKDELIWKQANYDHLTQLANRSLFRERFEQAIKSANRLSHSVAMCYIDLDKFKPVNDNFGHEVGDKLLFQVAARISQCVRETDTVARIGGDEFAVILTQLNDVTHINRIAEHIIQTLSEPFVIDGKELSISASVGISIYPQNGSNSQLLLTRADKAMYSSKTRGCNQFSFYIET